MEPPAKRPRTNKYNNYNNVCAVKFCKINYHDSNLYRFPKETERCKQWIELCGCQHLSKSVKCFYSSIYRVCNLHFEKKMYKKSTGKSTIRRLLPNSIPTLNLPPNAEHQNEAGPSGMQCYNAPCPLQDNDFAISIQTNSANIGAAVPVSNLDVSTQTPKCIGNLSPRKLKLQQKIHSLQSKVRSLKGKLDVSETATLSVENMQLEDFKVACDKFLPSQCAEFVKLQADLHEKKPHQRRYTEEFLQTCLKIYFMGPKAYRNISKIFTLPCKRTLNRITENMNFKPGFNDCILQSLKLKITSFDEIDKNCMICLDEMSIKSHLFYEIGKDEIVGFENCLEGNSLRPALNVLVVMVKGIYKNWKQPLAYFFVYNTCMPNTLKGIIEKTILELYGIGLKVRALVSDMGASNIGVSNDLNICDDKPVFTVNGEEIIYLFDTPHLIKAMRNNLMQNKFHFEGKSTSWKHIQNFYNSDKELNNRLTPKLTDAHINPSNMEKMRVYLAVQVLSATVAAAMNTYMSLHKLPREAAATITFIERFDKLFDILNSSKTRNVKEFNRAFKGLDYQIEFLKQMLDFFKTVRVLNDKNQDITNKIKSLRCFTITINGTLLLWDKLKLVGFEYLLTRRISQDALENYFGAVRQQGGNSVNPTPIQFKRAFKKLFAIDFFNSNNQNCLPDFDEILKLRVDNLNRYENQDLNENNAYKLNLKDCDYHFHDVEKNSIRYICGYLIRKCLGVHTCDICLKYANDHQDLDDTTIYAHFRSYQNKNLDFFGNLYMPNDNFYYYICELEQIFEQNFERVAVLPKTLSTFLGLYYKAKFQHPCTEFPFDYLVRLYSRMRLFYCLKFINANFRVTDDEGRKMQRKMIIWQHS